MPSFGSNSGNSGSKAGMPTNIKPKASAPASTGTMKAMDTIVQEVIRGEWGNGEERKQRLEAAGYSYEVVQGKVNRELSSIKSLDEVAAEVIRGNWGNGAERKQRLEAAGYNFNQVQSLVNAKLSGGNAAGGDLPSGRAGKRRQELADPAKNN